MIVATCTIAAEERKIHRCRRPDLRRFIRAPASAAIRVLLNRDQMLAAYVSYRTEGENHAH